MLRNHITTDGGFILDTGEVKRRIYFKIAKLVQPVYIPPLTPSWAVSNGVSISQWYQQIIDIVRLNYKCIKSTDYLPPRAKTEALEKLIERLCHIDQKTLHIEIHRNVCLIRVLNGN